jgi:16S rRNA (uracil1498-N3)-methyltransferase
MANLYYTEASSGDAFVVGNIIEISGDEARHAVRVARLRLGEHTMIGDGRGSLAAGEVVSVDRERFAVRIETMTVREATHPELVLVQALAKGDRDERAVEQATEFGVDAIVPWQAERSVSRWDGAGATEKRAKGVAKWARIAREAAKQSMRACIPLVEQPLTLNELCEAASRADTEVLVLHPRGDLRLSDWAQRYSSAAQRIMLVVGPEGGFADAELDALEAAGAVILVLGDTVLRTSSAGPAALAVLNAALGRW